MSYGDSKSRDDSEEGSEEERLSPIRGGSPGDDGSPSKKSRIDNAFSYGSPVARNKSGHQPTTMDSPFNGLAGTVSYNGASLSPRSCDWTSLSAARKLAQTPPPKMSHARLPSLFGDEHRADLSPLPECGGDKDEQQLEQAAVMAMRQISRSPSSSSHGGSQTEHQHVVTNTAAKATRRPPNTSVYVEDDDDGRSRRREEELSRQRQAYDENASGSGPMTPAAADASYAIDDPSVISSNAAQRKRARHARPPKPCNCKRSRCLKLYCECFAAGIYCKGCNCVECLNVVPSSVTPDEIAKRARVRQERDGLDDFGYEDRVRHCDAGGSPQGPDSQLRTGGASSSSSSTSKRKQHVKRSESGCTCKRSRCLKKYCECFEAGVTCDSNCRCIACLNRPGSPDLAQARQKLLKAEAKAAAAAAASNGNASSSRVSPRPLVSPCAGVVNTPAAAGQRNVVSGNLLLETPVNHSKKSGVPKLTKKKTNAGGAHDDLERSAREAWTDTVQRAIQRKAEQVNEARRDFRTISDHAAAAAAVVEAVEQQQQQSSCGEDELPSAAAVEVALDIATAAATEGAMANKGAMTTFAPTERDRERVACAVATATYGAVLNSHERNEQLASAAASWGHAAALAAQTARSEGGDKATVERCARERAKAGADESAFATRRPRTPSLRRRAQRTPARQPLRDVGDLKTRARRLEHQAEDAKTKLANVTSSLERLRKKLNCPSFRSKFDKHIVHLRWLNDRDGTFRAPGLPIHRPLVIKAFQCLSSEDLYGSCLVSRVWTGLALDKALWAFFSNNNNTNNVLSPERPISLHRNEENNNDHQGYQLNRRVSLV